MIATKCPVCKTRFQQSLPDKIERKIEIGDTWNASNGTEDFLGDREIFAHLWSRVGHLIVNDARFSSSNKYVVLFPVVKEPLGSDVARTSIEVLIVES